MSTSILPGTPSTSNHMSDNVERKSNDHRQPARPKSKLSEAGSGSGKLSLSDTQDIRSGKRLAFDRPTETQGKLNVVLRRNADYMLVFALLGVVVMILQNELAWLWNTEAGYGPFCLASNPDCDKRERAKMFPITNGLVVLNALRAVVSFATLLLLVFCYKFYATRMIVLKSKHLLPPTATLLGCSMRYSYIFESLVLAVHVFPGIDSVSTDPPLYLWMNLIMFVRVFLVLRCVRYHSPLLSSNGRFIGALTNVEFNASFILKTALKQHPVSFMAVCLVTLFVAAGYSIRLIDSLMCVARPEMGCDPKSFWDSQWLLAITILTVGYGDLVPHSDGARFVALVGGLTGTMITAITIALTTSYLNLSRSESRVVTFLRKDALRRMLQLASARALQAFYRYYTVPDTSPARKRRAERHLYAALTSFRSARKHVSSHDPVTPTDRQISLLETMEVNVDDIKAHLELLGGYLLGVPNMVPGLQMEAPGGGPGTAMITAGSAFSPTAAGAAAATGLGQQGTVAAAPSDTGSVVSAVTFESGAEAGNVNAAAGPLRRRRRRGSNVSSSDWVTDIRTSVESLSDRLSTLSMEMEQLQGAVERYARVTHKRMGNMEKRMEKMETSR